ncbi:MAG: hypothetical protein A4E28_00921 [Methanocella sp. PtaU1.Bin125]|nr:MAG: hypothetical protein A4E28_00921 [Methanocella sp. PtaU1.Bin125]
MGIIGYDDLAGYILSRYPPGARIVEVGVGRHPDVARLLQERFDLVCTDVTDPGISGIRFVRDDIFRPDFSLYRGAALVYSIRPPPDMMGPIAEVAAKAGADLIIRPFSSEHADLGRFYRHSRCINFKQATFYLYQP